MIGKGRFRPARSSFRSRDGYLARPSPVCAVARMLPEADSRQRRNKVSRRGSGFEQSRTKNNGRTTAHVPWGPRVAVCQAPAPTGHLCRLCCRGLGPAGAALVRPPELTSSRRPRQGRLSQLPSAVAPSLSVRSCALHKTPCRPSRHCIERGRSIHLYDESVSAFILQSPAIMRS